jgi:hypothetical protein
VKVLASSAASVKRAEELTQVAGVASLFDFEMPHLGGSVLPPKQLSFSVDVRGLCVLVFHLQLVVVLRILYICVILIQSTLQAPSIFLFLRRCMALDLASGVHVYDFN